MQNLQTSNGSYFKIDDCYFEVINQFNWFEIEGYAISGRGGNYKYLHVEVAKLAGIFEEDKEIDHKDRDRGNCQSLNLRAATRSQNNMNCSYKIGPSGFRGVSCKGKKFCARVSVEGERIWLGTFDTAIEAAKAFNRWAIRVYGEFATLNNLEQDR